MDTDNRCLQVKLERYSQHFKRELIINLSLKIEGQFLLPTVTFYLIH